MTGKITSEANVQIKADSWIIVSVIIPVYNEAKYIEKCIESILKQDYPKDKLEVIFIDGDSTDETVEIIKKYVEKYAFVRILGNPKRTVQFALNIGIKNASGEYIVRLDAHAEYAVNYISKCIEYILKTDADNVGGPMRARGKSEMQKVIAAAYHSPLALGGGRLHDETYEGYVDTVWLGAFKKKTIIDIGLYDENFPRSEDDELNYRLIKSGGKVFLTSEIKSEYYPRDSVKKLFKQYFEYGLWKPAVVKKHKKPARLSHLVPMLFSLFLIIGGIISFLSPIIAKGYVTVLVLYLLLVIYYSFSNKYTTNIKGRLQLCGVHFILHISYGLGFIQGIWKFYIIQRVGV